MTMVNGIFVKEKEEISNSKYQELYAVSKATATRDLTELVEKWELFEKVGQTWSRNVLPFKKQRTHKWVQKGISLSIQRCKYI